MRRIIRSHPSISIAVLTAFLAFFCTVSPEASAQNSSDPLVVAAKNGDAEAQFGLGYILLEHGTEPEQKVTGIDYLMSAADQGHLNAQLLLGAIHLTGGFEVQPDPILSTKYFEMAANQGDTSAQSQMGFACFKGRGILQDNAVALKWHRLAAENGNAASQAALAQFYFEGIGVPKNYKEAFKWQHAAAVQGDSNHQMILGWSYYKGQGVPKSYTHAYKWFALASSQGGDLPERLLSDFEKLLTTEQISEAQTMANQCYENSYVDCK